ncbi:MAG: DUF1761 domain-containing protein [Candidatus Marinimicrobia bacterium]|nr:DUF1761 domain-containing protein [Candidatus Neomarinimicrobiota bacterium]
MYDINYWAIIVSAIVFFALGSLWYTDILFGKAWRDSVGKSDTEFEKEQAEGSMFVSFGLMFLGALIMSFVTAHLVDLMATVYTDASNIKLGLVTGFWVWFGYIASYVLTSVAFEKRPWKYYFINTGYWLVGALMMGVILTVWK